MYWLSPHDLLSLLSFTTQGYVTQPKMTCPEVAPLTMGYALPQQSLILKKISHRSAYSPIKWKHFLNRGSLFPDDSSDYPVDKYLTSTGIFLLFFLHQYR